MDLVSFIQTAQYNLPLYLGGILLYIAIIWLAVVIWVWSDISNRTHSIVVQLGAVILTLGGNIMGLVIYLLLRPHHTIEEKESNSLFHASILDKDISACANCNTLVRSDFKHCPNCQHTLVVICDRCDSRLNPNWNFCVTCGKRHYPETAQEKLGHRIRNAVSFVFNIPYYTWLLIKRIWAKYNDFVAKRIITPFQDFRKRQAEAIKLAKQEKASKSESNGETEPKEDTSETKNTDSKGTHDIGNVESIDESSTENQKSSSNKKNKKSKKRRRSR